MDLSCLQNPASTIRFFASKYFAFKHSWVHLFTIKSLPFKAIFAAITASSALIISLTLIISTAIAISATDSSISAYQVNPIYFPRLTPPASSAEPIAFFLLIFLFIPFEFDPILTIAIFIVIAAAIVPPSAFDIFCPVANWPAVV
jgi:hypothetical protein